LKGKGQAILLFHYFWFEPTFDFISPIEDFQVKQVGFDAEEAAEAPTGDGHDIDQVGFDGGVGLELVYEIRAQELEVLGGFAVEKDGGGSEAMTAAVGGGAGFPFGRDRTVGHGSVGAGGFAFN
jgi:hypothetical protein